jgi:putative ABC transport system permease protein
VAIATALVFGIAPAVQTTAVDPSPTLKNDAPMSPSRSRMLPALVSAQVALSLVLLVGAGLFVRTLRNLHDVDAGFQPRGVLLVVSARAGVRFLRNCWRRFAVCPASCRRASPRTRR